jgi:prepilin-type N-terminal cleavage/methylation domain-containing protein
VSFQRSQPGFTLIELVIVLVVIATLAAIAVPELSGLSRRVATVDVQTQAKALRTRDISNIAACQSGGSNCIDMGDTGDAACRQAIEEFLPAFYQDQVQSGRYSVRNISSEYATNAERQERYQELVDNGSVTEQSAIFTVTRFLGDSEPPSDGWLDTYNPEQPCILYIED